MLTFRSVMICTLTLSVGPAIAEDEFPPVPNLSAPEIAFRLWTDETKSSAGLTASIVDSNIRFADNLTDWRSNQKITGTIIQREIDFARDTWPDRPEFAFKSKTRRYFSVQWDGVIEVVKDNTELLVVSDGGSHFWIDVDQNGQFAHAESEYIPEVERKRNVLPSKVTVKLKRGMYPIRIQYRAGVGYGHMKLSHSKSAATKPEEYVVRIAYLVPTDRKPQPKVPENLQHIVTWLQGWYSKQMDRHGYGRKTFQFESGADVPPVYTVRLPENAAAYQTMVDASESKEHGRAWKYLLAGAQKAGVPLKKRGEVWLLAYELHEMRSDGDIIGRLNRGGPFGYNSHNGAGTAFTVLTALATDDGFNINRPYDGMKISSIGPHPLRYGVSFREPAGKTLGSAISMEAGSTCHELSHAFGLLHNNKNDTLSNGSMMGNGYRQIRSEMGPRRYPGEAVNLTRSSARILNVNRHFNFDRNFTDNVPPTIESVTIPPQLINGHLEFSVVAGDNAGLWFAFLYIDGRIHDDVLISGTQSTAVLRSQRVSAEKNQNYSIYVYDLDGNLKVHKGNFISPKGNLAPIPLLQTTTHEARINKVVEFDATQSTDPDGSKTGLTIEWDFDTDGIFDTPRTQKAIVQHRFKKRGHHRVSVRLTDSQGATSISDPVIISVTE